MGTANYVGLALDGTGAREVFRYGGTPTETTHGARFGAVIGPFRTRRAAEFMASPAVRNNPHCLTVADAEQIARRLARKT